MSFKTKNWPETYGVGELVSASKRFEATRERREQVMAEELIKDRMHLVHLLRERLFEGSTLTGLARITGLTRTQITKWVNEDPIEDSSEEDFPLTHIELDD